MKIHVSHDPRRGHNRAAAPLIFLGALVGIALAPSAAPARALGAEPNPDLLVACGIDVVVVLDESGSIRSERPIGSAVLAVEDAVRALVAGLSGTGSRVRFTEFSTNARAAVIGGSAGFQLVDDAFASSVDSYLTGHAFGETAETATSYSPGFGQQYTNYEAGVSVAATDPGDLVVFITDGQPNTVGTAGDSIGGAGGGATAAAAAADDELDAIKGSGVHVVGIGVGAASNPTNFDLLATTIEPTKVPDTFSGAGIPDLSVVDAIDVGTDFGALDDALRSVVFALCAPSLTITKIDTAGTPIADWPFVGSVDVSDGSTAFGGGLGYDWVSPSLGATIDDGVAALGTGQDAPQTMRTDANGTAQFQWTPGSVEAPQLFTSTFRFSETLPAGWSIADQQPDCTVQRLDTVLGFTSFEVQLNLEREGSVVDITLEQSGEEFAISPTDIITCTIQNLRPTVPVPRVIKGAVEGDDTIATISEPGGSVTIPVAISNEGLPGTGDAVLTSLVDDVYGDVTAVGGSITATICPKNVVIAGGDTYTCSFTVAVDSQPATIHDIVTATLTNAAAPEGVSDDDEANVVVLDVPASIDVAKSADRTAVPEPGGDVTFTVTVTNTSAVDAVTIDSLIDSVYGDLNGRGDCAVPQVLAVGGGYSCSITEIVTGAAGDLHENVVTVTALDDDNNPITGTDDETVTISDVPSSIDIVKSAEPASVPEPGGDVAFTFVVTNTSAVDDVTIDSLIDSVYGDLDGQGDCSVPQFLPPGGIYSCSVTQFVDGVEGSLHTNVVTGAGVDDDGNPVSDMDEAIVTIAGPLTADLEIVKTATVPQTGAGGSFDWVLDVTNNGPSVADGGAEAALDVVVRDLVPDALTITGVESATFECAADGNVVTCTKSSMVSGESGRVVISVAVAADAAGGSITNVGTVESSTPDSDPTNDSDDATVDVVAQDPPPLPPPPPLTLPRTGSSAGGLLWGGTLVVLAGVAALAIGRRRRGDRHASLSTSSRKPELSRS
jgi:uncharacterized repeat protein (TIGR01451 family)/LPXTG-motif cell wall-anchored protein